MKDIIGIIGLGYVGLPLAIEFSNKFDVIGYDISKERINELRSFHDRTNEINAEKLKKSLSIKNLNLTNNHNELHNCNIFIITVPTPINNDNSPDLLPLIKATKLVSKYIKTGDIIIYESTVFPGCTEEICIPLIERKSKKLNVDFFVGYSPERINPGDKVHTLKNITKIISGSNEYSKNKINDLYKNIVDTTFLVKNIKIAEAAKIIENTQRDINIAFINELSMLFNKLNINTNLVLEAASTKWNFLNFKPGLVGGHCIGVDPYYLAFKAKQVNFDPKMILSGRSTNNDVPRFIVNNLINRIFNNNLNKLKIKVLILGLTFKENCPDVRNTKVLDIYTGLIKYKRFQVDITDPRAEKKDVISIFNKEPILIKDFFELNDYDVLIFAVNHEEFKEINVNILNDKIIIDLKNIYNNDEFWTL